MHRFAPHHPDVHVTIGDISLRNHAEAAALVIVGIASGWRFKIAAETFAVGCRESGVHQGFADPLPLPGWIDPEHREIPVWLRRVARMQRIEMIEQALEPPPCVRTD